MTAPSAPPPEVRPSALVRRAFGLPRLQTDGDVAALAFAADGTLWSVDESGSLRHWGTDGTLLKKSFLSDLETLWAFGPGAQLLASGNDDLLLWDVADGQLIRRVEQDSWVTALAFSPDGATLASGHDDGSVRFWDARTQKPVGRIAAHPAAVSAISFSPDGDAVATAGEDRVVRVWDADSHKKVADLVSHTDRVPALGWSADGKLLVSAGWDTSARVWEPGRPDPLMLLNSHADQVTTLAFGPAGLATADSDHDIHLWADPRAGTTGHVLRGHADEVRAVAFSPDGTRLASGGADRTIHLWDTATGELLAGPPAAGRHAVAVIPAGGRVLLASAGGPEFRLYDAATGADVLTGDPAASVAADPHGRWLAVGGTDAVVRLYNPAAPGGAPRLLEATHPPVGALAFAPKGNLFAHASPFDGLVWLWNPNSPSPDPFLILVEAADGCTLEGLAVHPDGNRVVVGGVDYLSTGERDGAVCIWDASTKEKVATFDRGVYAVAFDPTGRYLAGAGLTDRVYVWDTTTGEQVFDLDGHRDKVNAVAFSPDGSYLVSGSDDLTVRVWDVLSGRPVVAREFDTPVQSLAFGPDGATLFTGNGNATCFQIDFPRLIED